MVDSLTMMMLPMACLLFGMALGQRFKVLILLPAIGLAVVATIGAGVARADDAWSVVLMAVALTITLQIGYLVGTGVRTLIAAARAARLCRGSAPAAVRRAH